MIVTAWILFIFFGYLFVVGTFAIGTGKIKKGQLNYKVYFSALFITAFCAGVIWG